MKPVRRDLMELSPEALTALANAGFVKRALKDIAEGRGPRISLSPDGTIFARYQDGHQASLAEGRTLRDAACTCPAAKLCRHRVTLIPAYQGWVKDQAGEEAHEPGTTPEAWSPADFEKGAIEAAFKQGAVKEAALLARSGPTIRLVNGRPGQPPTAYLPMSTVRFFSAGNLAHARCDCLEGGGCAHVLLAVMAFQQAGRGGREFQEITLTLAPEEASPARKIFSPRTEPCLSAVAEVLDRLWAEGLTQPYLALEGQLAKAEDLAETLKWRWISESLADIRRMVQAYQARSSRFSAVELMNLMAFLKARLECAQEAEDNGGDIPAHQILGQGVAGETALEHLTLVGLGLELWEDDTRQGAALYFVDPDTMTLLTLERDFTRNEQIDIFSRRVSGLALKKIAQSQIVTRGAKRKANGQVNIAAEARLTNALPLSRRSWDQLGPPLKFSGARALLNYISSRPPQFIQPRQGLSRLAILPAGRVTQWGWDAGDQTLRALLGDRPTTESEGEAGADFFWLELPYRRLDKHSVNNLAGHLERGDLAEVCGLVELKAGRVVLRPLALTTAEEMVVLAARTKEEVSLPGRDFSQDDENEIHRVLGEARDLLRQFLLQGLRHRGPRAEADLKELARRMRGLGLPVCGGLTEALAAGLNDNEAAGRLRLLSLISLMLNELQKEEFR